MVGRADYVCDQGDPNFKNRKILQKQRYSDDYQKNIETALGLQMAQEQCSMMVREAGRPPLSPD
jgi:hypothetical protein